MAVLGGRQYRARLASQKNLLPHPANSTLGSSRETGKTLQSNPIPAWVQLAPPRWAQKKLGHWIWVPALASTNPGEVTGPLGISIPSALKWDALLVLASLGFWPGLNENVEGVLVVITGIKTAISQLISVENVNVWMPKDKDPAGPFRAPSSPPYCWEFVLFSLELPEQWVGSAAIHTPRGCIC